MKIPYKLPLIIALLTFLVYVPALQNGFVNWDDPKYVYENPHIRTLNPDFLKWAFTSPYFNNWHPLTMLSYALDYAVWELNPLGYHLTNIIFHTANTFLVFILAMRLIEWAVTFPTPNSKLRTKISASITTLLFGLHPLHVESVAWVSERKDVLSAFFFLLTLLAYINYVRSKNLMSYVFSLVSFILSLMSKPMAVSLPVVLLILDFYPLKRLTLQKAKNVFFEKIPFFLLAIIASIITTMAQSADGTMSPLVKYPLMPRLFDAARAFTLYPVKMLFPFGLATYYPSSVKFNYLEFIVYLTLLISLSLLCAGSLKKQRLFSAVYLYYTVTLLPVIGIVKVGAHAMADRYTYLPSLGPFLLMGLGIALFFEQVRRTRLPSLIGFFLMVILSVLFIGKTVRQTAVWHDSLTLWSHEIRIFTDNAPTIAYKSRGTLLSEQGAYEPAIRDLNMAAALEPRSHDTYLNRGAVYNKIGNYNLAIRDFSKAIEINPEIFSVFYNRGIAYCKVGDYRKAIMDFDKAIELNPRDSMAYRNRGVAYTWLSNYQAAISDLNKALELDPRDADAYNNRGIIYYNLKNYDQALNDYKKAVDLNPQLAEAYSNMGTVNARIGNVKEAWINYKKAEKLGFSRRNGS